MRPEPRTRYCNSTQLGLKGAKDCRTNAHSAHKPAAFPLKIVVVIVIMTSIETVVFFKVSRIEIVFKGETFCPLLESDFDENFN